EVSLLIMFGIVSRCSRERNFYAAGMEEVSMRSFASAIDKPILFQIGDELPNLTGIMKVSPKSETSKQCATSLNHCKASRSKVTIGTQRTASIIDSGYSVTSSSC